MLRLSALLLSAGAVCVCLLGGSAASAQTMTDGPLAATGITSTPTDFSLAFGIPQFNSSLGTLISAQVSFTGSIATSLTVTNNAASSSSGHANTKVSIGLTDPDGYLPSPAFNGSGTINPGGFATIVTSANDNYSLAPGGTVGPTTKTGSATTSMTFNASNDPIVLTELTGNGTVEFTAKTYTTTSVTNSGGNTSATQTTTASVTGFVTYTYAPSLQTPEPISASLVLAGLMVGTGFVRRTRV